GAIPRPLQRAAECTSSRGSTIVKKRATLPFLRAISQAEIQTCCPRPPRLLRLGGAGAAHLPPRYDSSPERAQANQRCEPARTAEARVGFYFSEDGHQNANVCSMAARESSRALPGPYARRIDSDPLLSPRVLSPRRVFSKSRRDRYHQAIFRTSARPARFARVPARGFRQSKTFRSSIIAM